MTQEICKKLYKQGKWSDKICLANCNRLKQVKCNFLEQRILEEANNPDRERNTVDASLLVPTSVKG